jgi:glycosyltransferase involved in cell wall biosynthesis
MRLREDLIAQESDATRPRDIDLSVVIPTYKRDETLRRCLEAVVRQDFPTERLEIVVVDDAKSLSTPSVIKQIRRQAPDITISLLPGRSRGPATARNIGWRAACGEVIAFIDDDAFPANERWLREGSASFSDPEVVGVSGAVHVPTDDPPTDFQRNVKGLERGEFLTCNAFYRRSALEAVGGFDEAFTVPFREDSDLQFRIEANGGKMVRAAKARVIHPAPPGRFGVSLRLQRYSMFNALAFKKHPQKFRDSLQKQPPLHYYAIVGTAILSVLALLLRRRRLAKACALLWAGLESAFFFRRIRGISHKPVHIVDMLITSLLIPPLSIYWRLRGALRFRVWFC